MQKSLLINCNKLATEKKMDLFTYLSRPSSTGLAIDLGCVVS